MRNAKYVRGLFVLVVITLTLGLMVPLTSTQASNDTHKPIDSIADVPRKARLALYQAWEARGNGDYEKSSRILLDFLERNPDDDHFLIRYHLGNSMSQTHTQEDQLEQYRRSVELEPRFDKAWMSLGEVAYNVGDYALAAEAFSNGFQLRDEKEPQVLYYAAAAYVMAERPANAVPLLEELVSGKWGPPKMDWYKALISAAIQLEDREIGDRAIDGMLGQFGNDPEAWTLAFQYAAGMEDYRGAAVALRARSYLEPLSREELIQLGDLYAYMEVPEPASDFYAEAMESGAEARELERLASVYMAAHNTDAALETLNRALEQEPSPRLWSLFGDLNFMEKNYKEAYEAYEKSAELDPDDGRVYLMMAYCAIESGDKDDAKEQLAIAADYPEQASKAKEILAKIDVYVP